MKKVYQTVIVMLALVLLLSVFIIGCNANKMPTLPTTVTGDTQASTLSTTAPNTDVFKDPFARLPEEFGDYTRPTDPNANVTIQYLPETVENPEDLPVLKWVVLTEDRYGGLNQTRSEEAVVEWNQMLADRDMPLRVQFVLLALDQRVNNANWMSRPEVQEMIADADLIWGAFDSDEMQEYLLPITEYVIGDAEPSLENAVPHALIWRKAMVNGEIYGIPVYPYPCYSNGWCVDTTMLTEFGLTEQDFKGNFWEMDDIFAKIYKENGNKAFLCIDGSTWTTSTHGIGALTTMLPSALYGPIRYTYQFAGAGFAIDHNSENPKVVNVLEEETARSVWSAIMRYQSAGYTVRNTQIDAAEYTRLVYSGFVGDSVFTDEDGWTCIPVTPSSFKSVVEGGCVSGIAATAQNKAEALQLIKLIAEDESFRMQLLFGKEGRDYEIIDGAYRLITRDDGSRYSLSILSPLSYFSGLVVNSEDPSSDFSPGPCSADAISPDGKSRLKTYRDVMDNVGFCYFPIIFDYTDFAKELVTIRNIFEEYFPDYLKIEGEDRMTEERYNEMLQKLKEAGSEKIQAELQRQLDEWLAANPDWQS